MSIKPKSSAVATIMKSKSILKKSGVQKKFSFNNDEIVNLKQWLNRFWTTAVTIKELVLPKCVKKLMENLGR